MQLTHLGHSCLLVAAGDARVLFDPGIFSPGFAEVPDVTAVVVTHRHADHLDSERLPLLLEAGDGVEVLAEAEVAAELRQVGIPATPLHPGASAAAGRLRLTGVGGRHAEIHPEIADVGNIGVVLHTPDGRSLFHPGDAYDAVPGPELLDGGVDVLALPLSAPWATLGMTVDFLRAVAPRLAVPVHDAALSDAGRSLYLRHLTALAPEGCEVRDLRDAGPTDV